MNKKVSSFFNQYSEEYKKKYKSSNFFHEYFFTSRLEIIVNNLQNSVNNILDIGSGTGNFYDHFKFNFPKIIGLFSKYIYPIASTSYLVIMSRK